MRATRRRAGKAPAVVRLHETAGSARTSFDAALKAAIKSARAEVSDLVAVEISRQWVDLGARGVATYHVSVKVAYRQTLAPPKRVRKAP